MGSRRGGFLHAQPPSSRRSKICLALILLCVVPQLAAQAAPSLLLPYGIAYDSTGNLYIADAARHQVFEATLGGAWLVVAGSGVQGFAGDGGAAAAAELNAPQAIAVGPDGTLYIADTGNQRIRTVVNGNIATIAGNGKASYFGDGGVATAASLDAPTALAIDATGALLVCDSSNHRLRRIANGIITTIAGNGIQGFAGDGGPATAAEVDTPSAVAVSSDGRIFISDTHNNRIRVIATNGIITTLATQLALPRGIVVTSTGSLLIADTNHQLLRSSNASGNLTTLAGSGVQGSALDGSSSTIAALNEPGGVAVSSFGYPTFSDTRNHSIRILAPNGNLYLPSALASGRTSSATLSSPTTAIYGQASATITVTGSVGTPQGTAQLLDGSNAVAQSGLSGGTTMLPLSGLFVGVHTLRAVYVGDGLNPTATSSASSLSITPAALSATANPQTILYGTAIPTLTGTLSGVLAQDSGNVAAVFTTTAQMLSPAGTYPITASLSGSASANYAVSLSATSGSLQITVAPSTTVAQQPAQSTFAGLPLLLYASVASATRGTPTGSVNFVEGSNTVATATLVSGAASTAYLAPAAGTHTIIASYSGDANFMPSVSPAITTVVAAMPDFSLATSGSATQTVQPGSIATYTLAIAAQPAPFSGAVSMSVSGLPTGATASFAPPQVVPGSTSATTVLSIQTPAVLVQRHSIITPFVLSALAIPLLWISRRRSLPASAALCLLVLTLGCGSRTVADQTQATHTYTLTVTGTSTNLAGALVTHSTTVALNVQ